jgi:tetratricopeptide (TPR) repeat protein
MSQDQSRICCRSRHARAFNTVHLLQLVVLLAAVIFTLACRASTNGAKSGERGPSTAGLSRAEYKAEKKRAIALLYDENNLAEALPILEKLAGENPEDLDVIELLSTCLFSHSPSLQENSAEQKNALIRSRELAQKAKKMGSTYLMMDLILHSVSADGVYVVTFSKDKMVDDVMKKGETFFVRNDIKGALEAYRSAEVLDPRIYEAPLFIGDCCYVLNQPEDAGRAFAKAIAIDPNRETAYRYWGDVLMKSGKMEEARAKFLEAIVAEPYSRLAWKGLSQWAMPNNKQIGHFLFKIPVSMTPEGDVVVDEKALSTENGTQNWRVYGAARVIGRESILRGFEKKNSDEKYRHSLAEECVAIRVMLSAVTDQVSKGELKSSDLDGPIQFFMKLDSEGLLEAYILLALADEGVSQDYVSYRSEHRDAVRRYLDSYVIHNKGK